MLNNYKTRLRKREKRLLCAAPLLGSVHKRLPNYAALVILDVEKSTCAVCTVLPGVSNEASTLGLTNEGAGSVSATHYWLLIQSLSSRAELDCMIAVLRAISDLANLTYAISTNVVFPRFGAVDLAQQTVFSF